MVSPVSLGDSLRQPVRFRVLDVEAARVSFLLYHFLPVSTLTQFPGSWQRMGRDASYRLGGSVTLAVPPTLLGIVRLQTGSKKEREGLDSKPVGGELIQLSAVKSGSSVVAVRC